jgi:hypothetical protein
MNINYQFKGMGKEVVMPFLKVLSQHLSSRTEENHKKPQLGQPVYKLRIEPGAS